MATNADGRNQNVSRKDAKAQRDVLVFCDRKPGNKALNAVGPYGPLTFIEPKFHQSYLSPVQLSLLPQVMIKKQLVPIVPLYSPLLEKQLF